MWFPSFRTSRRARPLPARPVHPPASHRLRVEPLEDRSLPSFLAPVGSAIGEPDGSLTVAVADFNRDGTPDLVVLATGNGSVSVALGNHDGTFQPAHNFDVVGFNPTAVAVGDFNGDGNPDIVTTDNYDGDVN